MSQDKGGDENRSSNEPNKKPEVIARKERSSPNQGLCQIGGKTLRNSGLVFLALVMVIALATVSMLSCAKAPEEAAAPPEAEAPEIQLVKLGVVTPLSGPAAPWGTIHANCFKLAADWINDAGGFVVDDQTYNWEVASYDSRYDPSEALSAVTKLVDEGVKYMSICGGAPTVACLGVTDPANVLVWAWASIGGTDAYNEYTFQNQQEVEGNAASYPWLRDNLDIRTIATIYPNDETGWTSDRFNEFLMEEMEDFEIIEVQHFERGTTDFYPVFTGMLQKNPDAIDFGTTPPDTIPLMVKQLHELGYEGIMFCGNSGDPALILETAGADAAEGVVIPMVGVQMTPERQAWQDGYVEKYGAESWFDLGFLLHHGVYAITQAIEETQSLDPMTVAEYLPTMEMKNHLYGASPPFFSGSKLYGNWDHLVLLSGPMSQIQNGEVVPIGEMVFYKGLLD